MRGKSDKSDSLGPPERKLEIERYRAKIVGAIETSVVTIIRGDTGSGKSTLVPQFILDEHVRQQRGWPCNIMVVEPRRVAAVSLAHRVAERDIYAAHKIVGYRIGMDSRVTSKTRITYVTTGILLNDISKPPGDLSTVTHLIIDEVHERSIDMDFVLMAVREILFKRAQLEKWQEWPPLRVTLMSATADVGFLTNYFRGFVIDCAKRNADLENELPPVVTIEGRRRFNVRTHFTEQIEQLYGGLSLPTWNYSMDRRSPLFNERRARFGVELIWTIVANEHWPGVVLVFLPGLREIETVATMLFEQKEKVAVVRMHAQLPPSEIAEAFKKLGTSEKRRKVILSTNMAETSITIPDVTVVVDFCLTRREVRVEDTFYERLEVSWASQAEILQRRGRAGRVGHGAAFHLIPEEFFQKLPLQRSAEVHSSAIERLVLKCKHWLKDARTPWDLLRLMPESPTRKAVLDAILRLKLVGGLSPQDRGGVVSMTDGCLTHLGKIMEMLPIDIHLSRFLYFAFCFGVLPDAVGLTAVYSTPVRLFSHVSFENRQKILECLVDYGSSSSDLILLLEACKVIMTPKKFYDPEERLEQLGVNPRAVPRVRQMGHRLKEKLEAAGFLNPLMPDPYAWFPEKKLLLLQVALCAGFYPYYFTISGKDDKDVAGAVEGRNPKNCVYLQGFPGRHQKYEDFLRELFRAIAPVKSFCWDEGKVVVEFPALPSVGRDDGGVNPAVIAAVAMRKKFSKAAVKGTVAERRTSPDVETSRRSFDVPGFGFLDFPVEEVEMRVTSIEDEVTFCVSLNQPREEDIRMRFEEIADIAGTSRFGTAIAFPPGSGVLVCLAGEEGIRNGERAKILRVSPDGRELHVLLIDQGVYWDVDTSWVACLTDEDKMYLSSIPPLAFKCRLHGAALHPLIPFDANRGKKSRKAFEDVKKDGLLRGEVFCEADGVLLVDIPDLQHRLLGLGLVSVCEDNEAVARKRSGWLSELHQLRISKRMEPVMNPVGRGNLECPSWARDWNVPDPPDICDLSVSGPFSPLEQEVFQFSPSGDTYRQAAFNINSPLCHALIDADYDRCEDRLIVVPRASIRDGRKESLLMRHCLPMPKIPGLGALVTALFAPEVEIELDASNSRVERVTGSFGSVLSHGAGRNVPMGTERNTSFDVDDFTVFPRDLQLIDVLRKIMNNFFDEKTMSTMNEKQMDIARQRLVDGMCDLLLFPRWKLKADDRILTKEAAKTKDGREETENEQDANIHAIQPTFAPLDIPDSFQPTENQLLVSHVFSLLQLRSKFEEAEASGRDYPVIAFCHVCGVGGGAGTWDVPLESSVALVGHLREEERHTTNVGVLGEKVAKSENDKLKELFLAATSGIH